VDDKENLKDIMQQLAELPDDEKRIKEELFRLLWFFIMTFDSRLERIRTIIKNNRELLVQVIGEFKETGLEEEEERMMEGLVAKLQTLGE